MAHQYLVSSDDLTNWEFINQSDAELQSNSDDSNYDVQSIDFADSLSSYSDHEQSPAKVDLEYLDDGVIGSPSVNCVTVLGPGHEFGDSFSSFWVDLHGEVIGSPPILPSLLSRNYCAELGYYDLNGRLLHQDGVDDDDDDDGDYGVDEELVPWGMKDKLERQRIRKQGKLTSAKMLKSKRAGHIFTRRGCVRGKQGLGLKANN